MPSENALPPVPPALPAEAISELPPPEMAFCGDALTFSATDHLRRKALSPSAMLAVERCPARWAAEATIPRPDDPFGAAELGSAAHSVMEALCSLPPPKRSKGAAWDALEALKPPGDQAVDLTAWRAEVWGRTAGLWHIARPETLQVAATEVRLEAQVDDVPLRGIIDLSAMTTAGAICLVDYKTGKPPRRTGRWPGYPDQLRVYALLWKETYDQMPALAELWYTRYGVSKPVDMSSQALAGTMALARRSWGTLCSSVEANSFTATSSPLCPWCPLVATCPVAQRAGYAPKEPAPTPTYRSANEQRTGQGASEMSETTNGQAMVNETRPWHPFCDDGTPNWASYQASNVRKLVILAKDSMVATHQTLGTKMIGCYTVLFAEMVYEAQRRLGRKPTLQSALATTLVAFLENSAREVLPPTLTAPDGAMDAYVSLMTGRLVKLAQLAYDVMMGGTDTSALLAESA